MILKLIPNIAKIDSANNGLKALEKISEHIDSDCDNDEKYKLIFMDVQMPEMDGIEATMEITKLR